MSKMPPPGAKGPSWPGGRRGSRGPSRGSHPSAPPFVTGPVDLDPHLVLPQREPSGTDSGIGGAPPPPPGPRNPPPPTGNPAPPPEPPKR
ncbi:hypothetical protein ABT095_25160 [Kitasatospora sp. NPDC002227]|uniref:hypothetical protein n=1 Tax=Kitasatospora sp. NPDC002227 TaxID=3154773 RepID=UPI0033300442